MSKWEKVKLGEIGDFKSGGTPTRSKPEYFEGEIPWITTTSLGKIFIDESDTTVYISEEAVSNSATKIISKNSIMIGIRVGVGKVSINKVPMCTSQDIVSIENVDETRFYKPYIVHCIKSYSQYFETQKRGATIQGINGGVLKSIDIPLPPLETQKQIAKTLDAAAELLAMRQQQLSELDNLIKSTFYDMFGDPITNEKKWEVDALVNITKKIGSGSTPRGGKESYQEQGISLIRSMNVHNGIFKYEQLAYINDEQARHLDNVTIHENDVLINITGASVARSCIVPSDVLPARVNQHVSIVRLKNEKSTPEYINHMFINDSFQNHLLSIGMSGGATREAITKQQLQELIVPLPPLQLQTQFANIVTKIEEQKAIVKQAIDETQHLFDSLMSEYFE